MDSIRIMIIGAGGSRGRWFVSQLSGHKDFKVVALVDQLPDAARLIAQDCGLSDVPVHTETVEALDAVACDAVLVATSDYEHVSPAVSSLERGKHVFVEKPLAINLEGCQTLVEADRRAGERTMVGFNLRFAPLYRKLKDLVLEGTVGRVLTIQADEFYYGGRTYFRRWNRLRRYGGGLWITKASHDFDLLYWLSGGLPLRVSASARLTHYVPKPEGGIRCSDCPIEPTCPDSHLRDSRVSSPLGRQIEQIREEAGWPPTDLCLYNSEKDTFDHGIAVVEFDNDVLSTYTVNVVAPFTDRRVRIGGTDGVLQGSLSDSNDEILFWRRHQDQDPNNAERIPLFPDGNQPEAGHGGADRFILDDFAAFVRGQPSQAIGPAEASVAIALGVAATQSSDDSRSVDLNELAPWRALAPILSE